MNAKPSLFSELRRRNVFRVALTYAVVAWLLIEIASVLLPLVDAPESLITAFVVLLALGFAVAVFISWSFEMTPEGLKRTQDLSPERGHSLLEPSQVRDIHLWRRRHCVLSFCLPPALSRASAEPFTRLDDSAKSEPVSISQSSPFGSPSKNRAVPNRSSNFFVISMPIGRKLQQLKMSSRQSPTIRMTRSCSLQTRRVQRRRRRFEMAGKRCSPVPASSSLGSRPECRSASLARWHG